jgi:hypothetical protein
MKQGCAFLAMVNLYLNISNAVNALFIIIFPFHEYVETVYRHSAPYRPPTFHQLDSYSQINSRKHRCPWSQTWRCIQKFPDWLPGARTANGTALCHQVQLYRHCVSQSSEFCRHNPLCCFSTSVYCCKRIFRYRLSPETFGYIVVYLENTD